MRLTHTPPTTTNPSPTHSPTPHHRPPTTHPDHPGHGGSDADKAFYREVALNSQKILNGLMDSAAKSGAAVAL